MNKNANMLWLSQPEDHDYTAAMSYLSLIYDEKKAALIVSKLRRAKGTYFKSKDIFRASNLSLLGISNFHVQSDQKKIRSGQKLSPLLLVRDTPNGKLLIADGYHRMCAVYAFDEDAIIPCKII
jgi:hypothetical protein